MRALVLGSGRPVVLVHGFPDSALVWRKLAPLLVAAGYRVLMLDMRGYGESAMAAGKGNYSLEQLGSDVLALMDHTGIGRAAFRHRSRSLPWRLLVCGVRGTSRSPKRR
jgi:pimeloyl-ACP methyl ester carboxylesterase